MLTLRSILCPIDFSEHSRDALRWAEALADRHQSRLIVLSAVDPVLAEGARVKLGVDLAAAEVEPSLREFAAASWRTQARGEDAVFQVQVGEPADVILDAAKGADLVVMGTHGLGGVRKWLLGSTTQRVLRRAQTPVLAIPAGAATPGGAGAAGPTFRSGEVAAGEITSVLAASDLSDVSLNAMRWAVRFATAYGVPLTLAHVVEPVVVAPQWQPYVQTTDQDRIAAAHNRLQRLAEEVSAGPAETIVSLGRPDEAIASIAEQRAPGLIVLGLGGRTGFLDPRPGSIAYRVLCGAKAPVLVVPPDPQAL